MKKNTFLPLAASILLYLSSIVLFVGGTSRSLAVLFFCLASCLLCLYAKCKRTKGSEKK